MARQSTILSCWIANIRVHCYYKLTLQTRANKQSFPSADDEQSQYSNPVLPTGESLGIDALHFSPFPRHLWANKTSPTEPALNNVSQRCQRHGNLPRAQKIW